MGKQMKICSKCKKKSLYGSIYVEGGSNYFFCKECTKILDSFSDKTHIMPIFMKKEELQSQFEKNIFAARKRRAENIYLW